MRFINTTRICTAIILGLLIFACKPSGDQGSETGTPAEQQAPSQNTPSGDQAMASLGSIQIEAMRDLWENCDGLDIIFYETNFSLSQTEKAAIQNTLGYFGPMQVVHNPDCKPVGRITFLVTGDIRQEADIYIAQGCQYFIWFKDNKPAYINPMSPQGVNFFEQIMKKGTSTFQ